VRTEEHPRTQSADYVHFLTTGAAAKGEFHCSSCGYGVIVHRALPACPMCRGEIWERALWSPFARTALSTKA
jgi:rubrerythrin